MMQLPYTRTRIQVRFSDLDFLGHVSNSVYAQYFDLARIDFFTEVEKLSPAPHNVVASVKMDMLHEIRFDHEVVVDSWCSRVGNKSMTIEHHIYANGECATTCSTIIVGFDRKTRAAIALPDSWQPTDSSKIPPPPAR